ncbi:MAG: rod shape-determining protein MreC [Proteobacteria bacterium]|nr:rod shape-determining protein MreC [Pseudomonadota bacterium]MBU1716177.1 rod shape-determining protein MreC [Pseudomonadota bacterium]
MRRKGKRYQPLSKILLLGFCIALFMILVVSTAGNKEFNSPHKFVLEIIGTAQAGVTSVLSSCKNVWYGYVALWDVRKENNRLQKELQEYKAINIKYREAMAVSVRLEKLLEMKESLPPPTLTAQIIGKDPSQWFRTIIIDRGASDGVEKGMPVVTAAGVVGQVMNTAPHYSKVLLANDPSSAIDGLVQETRAQGIIKGKDNIYKLHYVFKNSEVIPGDQIVTSGLGGVFPKGLPIGTVSKVENNRRGMFQQIEVLPAVNFTQLEYLIIIMKSNSLAE